MQERADATFAQAMAHLNGDDENIKAVVETQINVVKAEVASLRMAQTQTAILHGSARPAGSDGQRACGPFGTGACAGADSGPAAPMRWRPGSNGFNPGGSMPCHCRHHDLLAERVAGIAAKLEGADAWVRTARAAIVQLQERGKFLKRGVFNAAEPQYVRTDGR